jgi:glycosyltransferase involved in cell wall biosynthesis
MQHVRLPENFDRAERRARARAARSVANEADLVIVSSAAVARDFATVRPSVEEKLRVVNFRTVVTPDVLDHDPAEVVDRYGLEEPFLLVANQFWVHKNHRLVFEAVAMLRERGLRVTVACTGEPGDYRHPDYVPRLLSRLDELGIREQVRILGVVPRADYLQLLRTARLVLQPSLFEGWSSVVEDARALGRPIVLSDIEVHREQAPTLALFHDPTDADDLARRIEQALQELTPLGEEESATAQSTRVQAYAERFRDVAAEAVAAAESRYTSAL